MCILSYIYIQGTQTIDYRLYYVNKGRGRQSDSYIQGTQTIDYRILCKGLTQGLCTAENSVSRRNSDTIAPFQGPGAPRGRGGGGGGADLQNANGHWYTCYLTTLSVTKLI
jgi:hypothetical protein